MRTERPSKIRAERAAERAADRAAQRPLPGENTPIRIINPDRPKKQGRTPPPKPKPTKPKDKSPSVTDKLKIGRVDRPNSMQTVVCKAEECTGTDSEIPDFKFHWRGDDPRLEGSSAALGVNDFRLAVAAIKTHLRRYPTARDQLGAMTSNGALIEVMLRVSRKHMPDAFGRAKPLYRGYPNALIEMRASESIDREVAPDGNVLAGSLTVWDPTKFGEGATTTVHKEVRFETVMLHEVGHTVGAFINGGWKWGGIGFDGIVGGNSPDNPILQQSIIWDNDARQTYGMDPLPANTVHPSSF